MLRSLARLTSSGIGATRPKFLMCRPTYFDVNYSINPWMSQKEPANRMKANEQWESLRENIIAAGGVVQIMEPDGGEDFPDLVFTANAALVSGRLAYLATFAYPQRAGETALNREFFRKSGYTVIEDAHNFFEGAGDALFAGYSNVLFSGYGQRSSAGSAIKVAASLSTPQIGCKAFRPSKTGASSLHIRVVPCHLISPRFYHLDVAFCPLNESLALWHPAAFDPDTNRRLANHIKLLQVPECEASNFACNAVVVNDTVILQKGNPLTGKLLQRHGFAVSFVDMSEFIKAGGSAKCCTLRLE